MNATVRATIAAALGCVAVATAVPATANEKLPAPAYKMRYDAKTDRFCLRPRGSDAVPLTGTLIVPTQCKTQGQWAAEGLTVARK